MSPLVEDLEAAKAKFLLFDDNSTANTPLNAFRFAVKDQQRRKSAYKAFSKQHPNLALITRDDQLSQFDRAIALTKDTDK